MLCDLGQNGVMMFLCDVDFCIVNNFGFFIYQLLVMFVLMQVGVLIVFDDLMSFEIDVYEGMVMFDNVKLIVFFNIYIFGYCNVLLCKFVVLVGDGVIYL